MFSLITRFFLIFLKPKGEEHVSQLDHLKYLVIDEADRMVEQGHFHELSEILDRIHRPRLSNPFYLYNKLHFDWFLLTIY